MPNQIVHADASLESALSPISVAWQRWGAVVWGINLLGMVISPNSSGAGARPFSGLLESVFLLVFLAPFVWLPFTFFQHKILKKEGLELTFSNLACIQILLLLPSLVLFAFFPSVRLQHLQSDLNTILSIFGFQVLLVLTSKTMLLWRWGVHHWNKQTRLLLLDLIAFSLLWGGLILPVDLTPFNGPNKQWAVKSGMDRLQTMIETYGVDADAVYPENSSVLKRAAQTGGYWKEIDLIPAQPYFLWQALQDHLQAKALVPPRPILDAGNSVSPYGIRYVPSHDLKNYFIYGYDGAGQLISESGQPLIMCNS